MSDYISREAAIAYIREQSEEMSKAFEELGGESGIYADAYNDLAEDFYRIPAADVEPVRHVRIREGEDQYVEGFGWFRWDYCLNCGSGFDITGRPRYCPYCGGNAVLESGPPIPVEHVEATEEETEAFFQALENTQKPKVPKPCCADTVPVQQGGGLISQQMSIDEFGG